MSTDNQAAGLPCPRCRVDLLMSDRAGVEIDYCPKCRGVWLDSGELDRIIERSAPAAPPAAAQPAGGWAIPAAPDQRQAPPPWGGSKHGRSGHGYQGYDSHGGKRRKSWIQRIFD